MAKHRALKERFWTLPNVLSLSRIPFGFAIWAAGVNEQWPLALVLLLAGSSTDYLDGKVARWTGSITKIGGDTLDPIGDGAVTLGAVLGLLFADHISLSQFIAFLVISLAPHSLRFLGPRGVWLADNILRVWYLGLLVALYWKYIDLALSGTAQDVVTAALAVALVVAAIAGWDHVKKDWLPIPAKKTGDNV